MRVQLDLERKGPVLGFMIDLPQPLQQVDRVFVKSRGRTWVYFGGCDYFRLASHPAVVRAAHDAIDRFGLNVAASRRTSGNHAVYNRLESALKRFFGAPSAVLTSNGYSTAIVVAQALAGDVTHLLLDEHAHGCLVDAGDVLRCKVVRFAHRNVDDLRRKLRALTATARVIVATDGMFSATGSLAPLPEYLKALPASGRLWIDDAHGAGALGKTGKGTWEALTGTGPFHGDERVLMTLTLSKSFGCYGGGVLGPQALSDSIRLRSRLFTGNTPLPPPFAAASLKAVEILRKTPRLRTKLLANVTLLRRSLRGLGWPVEDSMSPVLALMPTDEKTAPAIQKRMHRAGILPPFMRYPGGNDSGFFRIALSSEHTREQIKALVSAVGTCPPST